MQLYKLSQEILELANMDSEGDLSFEEAIANSLADLDMELLEKADNIGKFLRNMETEQIAIQSEIERLMVRKSRLKETHAQVKKYMLDNMQALERKSIKTALFSFTDRIGVQVLKVDDQKLIPDDYIAVEVVEKNKNAEMLKALKDGEEIPGVHMERNPNTLTFK